MIKKYSVKSMALILLLAFSFVAARNLGDVAAIVNNNVITSHDLDLFVGYITIKNKIPESETSNPNFKNSALEFQIDRSLQADIASRLNISVDDTEFDSVYKNYLSSTHINEDDLEALLQKNNISKDYFISEFKLDYIISKAQQNYLMAKLKISNDEINSYINQYYLDNTQYNIIDFHVDTESNKITAAKFSELISESVKNYTSAKEVNLPVTVTDLGDRVLTNIPEIYQAPVKNLVVGKVSPMIIAPNGYHTLLLNSKHEPEKITPQQAKNICTGTYLQPGQ